MTNYSKSGNDGRLVITGMVVSSRVLAAVAQKWTPDGLFGSAHLDRIGGWCIRHFNKYGKAPGAQIASYHRRWAEAKNRPDEESQAIQGLLSSLSEEYIRRERKTIQSDYVIQVATDLFTGVRVAAAAAEAKDLAANGKLDEAVAVLQKVDRVEMTQEDMTDIFTDTAAITSAFESTFEPLVVYPGAAGVFFGNRLRRRAFVSFEAMEKKGKSFWLMDVAWRALEQGRRVAYFEMGDLSKEDVIMRLAARSTGKPVDPEEMASDPKGRYRYPLMLEPAGGREKCEVQLEDRLVKVRMTSSEAKISFAKQTAKYGIDKFKVSCHPTKTLSVAGIQTILARQRSKYFWVPDVIVVDYADIIAPMHGTADTRDQINHTWAMLRSLSMSSNSLVLTATQTNRGSYDAKTIDMEHAAEDKRKRSHVTFSIGINQTDPEKEEGVYRLNPIVARTGQYDKRKCLFTAGCLAVANPCVFSTF